MFHKFLCTVPDINFSFLHFPPSVLHSPGTTFYLLSRGQHGFADFQDWAVLEFVFQCEVFIWFGDCWGGLGSLLLFFFFFNTGLHVVS